MRKGENRKKLMIWFRRVLVVIGLLVSGLVGYALLTAIHTEHPVGFQIMKTTDADRKAFHTNMNARVIAFFEKT